MRKVLAVLISLSALLLFQQAHAQISDRAQVPIYGILGTLQPVESQPRRTELVTDAGTYLIVGSNATIERQIQSLRAQTPSPQVQVWGNLQSPFSGPQVSRIVATEILPVDAASATPMVREPPQAIISESVAQLYAQPDSRASVVGQVARNTPLTILGREPTTDWLQVCCVNGETGWVAPEAVTISDVVTLLPVIRAEATPPSLPEIDPAATPGLPMQRWWATFYNDTSLTPPPTLGTSVQAIDFTWGENAPFSRVNRDDFSARFERILTLPNGFYEFTVQADDGVRVWLGDELVVDEWHLAAPPRYRFGRQIENPTPVRIEYFDAGGPAKLRFDYELVSTFPDWKAAYFDTIDLAGGPDWIEAEPKSQPWKLRKQWSLGSPVAGVIPDNNWSAQFEGAFEFKGGNYLFRARANDGVRLWLDDTLVLDGWQDNVGYLEQVFYAVGPGEHTVRVDYYERGGRAQLEVDWYRLGAEP